VATALRHEVESMELADACSPFEGEMHEALQALDGPARKQVLHSLQLLPPIGPRGDLPSDPAPNLIRMRVWF